MPRVSDNVTGKSPFIRADADNAGYVRALNKSTAALSQYQPVILTMDEDGWCFGATTQAASTVPKLRYMGIVQEAMTASQGNTADVHFIGPGHLLSTVAHTAGYAIIRSTGATVESIGSADFSGAVGEWAVSDSTASASTTPQHVYLTGFPLMYVTSTVTF